MSDLNRREMFVGLSAFAALGVAVGEGQTGAASSAAASGQGGMPVLSQARVFEFDQMPVYGMANGGESRRVVTGTLVTGEAVSVHESELAVGMKPNTPHTIQHSEFIIVREGTVAFEHDGKSEKVGPGGVIFVAPGTLHTLRNVGDGPAKYCVVAMGGDVKK
jgi:mannose-6-phosphate isomerase-like protein (cupin superfamily)